MKETNTTTEQTNQSCINAGKCAERMKHDISLFLDQIGTNDPDGQEIIKLIYGLTYSGYKEYTAGRRKESSEV